MSRRTRMILAIIALVLMVGFTIAIVLSLYDAKLLGGSLFYLAMACGVVGIGIYVILMRDTRLREEQELHDKLRDQAENEEEPDNQQAATDNQPAITENEPFDKAEREAVNHESAKQEPPKN